MPLMISSKWKLTNTPTKDIDLIQTGRKNEKLHLFAIRFTKEHPEYEYVFSGIDGTTGDLKYFSTEEKK